MYIKGLVNIVNTKDQSNACMCEMMSKGSKEVLIVSHVTHVEMSKVMFVAYVHNIDTFNAMSKGPKDNFLDIQPIFKFYVCISTCFDTHNIWWYGWKGLSLCFPKFSNFCQKRAYH